MVEKVPSLKGGGAYWFTDLTTRDDLFILPVLTSISFFATVEVCIMAAVIQASYLYFVFKTLLFLFQINMQDGKEGNPVAKSMKEFFRFFGVILVPFTIGYPKVCKYELLRI
jgi:YidC/Oxa1 family membrane protein insertase